MKYTKTIIIIILLLVIGFLLLDKRNSTILQYQNPNTQEYFRQGNIQPIEDVKKENNEIPQQIVQKYYFDNHYISIDLPTAWVMKDIPSYDSNLISKTFSGTQGQIDITYFKVTEFGGTCFGGIQGEINFKSLSKTACVYLNEEFNQKTYTMIYFENGDRSGYSIDVRINQPFAQNELYIKNLLKTLELK